MLECNYCGNKCIKKGIRSGIQRFRCQTCMKYQINTYRRQRIGKTDTDLLVKLNNEGMGISSISRILSISKSSVQRIILRVQQYLKRPEIDESDQSYEIDELRTYVGNKKNECWVTYAINKQNGIPIDLVVGRRTTENLRKVVNTVLSFNPKAIFTDGLNIYKGIIPEAIHKIYRYNTNKIERMNLNLRTHIKRLARKTICYSKNQIMLESCLKLYLWE
ncbi:MAG: IS1 family transposase [Bacteroidales bacterium]|nr:IS1 family transposase [Bacteroidales bacterium]MCF8458385.1 IS1 family transposase [Bacteroidales bacterium]